MIASIAVPLFDAHTEPPELRDTPVKMEGTINGGSCTGHDACRGTDAGNTYATAINLTNDFDWDGTNETNVYFGSHSAATGYSSTSDNNNDFFIVDAPPGYGVTATVTWNHTGGGTYDNYAYRLHIGPTGMVGWSYNPSSSYGGSWGYCYYSTTGELSMSTEVGEVTTTNPPYCYFTTSSYDNYVTWPHDLAGDPMMIGVNCYYCYYATTVDDYQLEVSVWPGDAGLPGDQVQPLTGAPILEMGGGYYWGTGGSPSGTSWSSISDTFTLSAGQEVGLDYECDYWYPMETAVSLTAPNGTSYSWGVGSIASSPSGNLGPYSGAGT